MSEQTLPDEFDVQVTADHIARGRLGCSRCPVALALSEVIGEPCDVGVYHAAHPGGAKPWSWAWTHNGTGFIRAFDADGPDAVRPTTIHFKRITHFERIR